MIEGAKTYPIRMRPDLHQCTREGKKTQTRRIKEKWLKVKKGDRLRVLNSGGMILEATEDARMERLRSITRDDALAEGITLPPMYADEEPLSGDYPLKAFRALWDSINPEDPFDSDPDVVVLTFRVLTAREVPE